MNVYRIRTNPLSVRSSPVATPYYVRTSPVSPARLLVQTNVRTTVLLDFHHTQLSLDVESTRAVIDPGVKQTKLELT